MFAQDAVVARQYINDNAKFQQQAKLWTGEDNWGHHLSMYCRSD